MKKTRQEHNDDADLVFELEDFYKMLQNGNPNIAMRTILLIKFQAGLDSATFADDFNFNGYRQIVKYYKTDDHSMWDLDACPIPIKMARVKTHFPHTTFIDRDAVMQLKEYLTWKEATRGKHDASKPLFVTKFGKPIQSTWISRYFCNCFAF